MRTIIEPNDIKPLKKMLKIMDFIEKERYTLELDGNGNGYINLYDAKIEEIHELNKRGAQHLMIGVTRGSSKYEKFYV